MTVDRLEPEVTARADRARWVAARLHVRDVGYRLVRSVEAIQDVRMFGHQHWVQAKSDIDDPDLQRPGGFQRQVRGRILGSLILLVVLIVALAISGSASA